MTELTSDALILAFARSSLQELANRPIDPLDWVLTPSEARVLASYVADLLFSGHTPRQVLQGITGVWATEV